MSFWASFDKIVVYFELYWFSLEFKTSNGILQTIQILLDHGNLIA
jgi:hypothetical protein